MTIKLTKINENAKVTLECTICQKRKPGILLVTDPPETALIRMQCPDCVGGDFEDITYFDKDGKQIYYE